jgi:transposase
MRMMGAESVAYHRGTVIERADDHPGAALAYYASNHETGRFVWGEEGKDAATLDGFFDELGSEASATITAISMDMGPAYEKSARVDGHAVKAIICYEPFHVVKLATDALDKVRRPSGRRYARCRTRRPPSASRGPAGPFSRTPRT